MNRRTAAATAAAACALVAVGLAAATLDDRRADPGEPGMGDRDQPISESMDPITGIEIPFLQEVYWVVLAIFLLVAAVYLVTHFREVIPIIVAAVAIVGLVYVLLHILPFDPATQEPPAGAPDNMSGPPGGEDGTVLDPTGEVRWFPAIAIIGLVGVILLVAIVASAGARLMQERASAASEASSTTTDPSILASEIAEAAGRAADRIEDADAYENEVFRAWAEMVELLDMPDPAVATPGQFAEEAVAAGMDPEDIRDLTRLFEDVRYGARSPTPEREDSAVRLLRRIEARYTGDE